MKTSHYEYFLTILECGSITKAAQKLFISQPSLTRYLHRLEEEAGTLLFDRSSTPLKLTPAGECYHEYIQKFRILDIQYQSIMKGIIQGDAGTVRIGIPPWRGAIILPDILDYCRRKHPFIDIEIEEGSTSGIELKLLNNDVDFCLMNLPSNYPSKTISEVLMNEHLLLVGNIEHPVVKQLLKDYEVDKNGYRNVDIHFLNNEYFIFEKPGQNLTELVKQIFAIHNIIPRKTWATSNMTTALNIVSKSQAFTIMAEDGARSPFHPDNLAFFTFNHPPAMWQFAAVYQRNKVITQQSRYILDAIKELMLTKQLK